MNLEVAIGAQRFKILIRAIFTVLIAMVNGEMMRVFVAAFFAAEFAFSFDRDDEPAHPVIAFTGQIFPQNRTSARTKHDVLGRDCFPANRARSLFRANARTVVLLVASGCFDREHLAASFAGKLLARLLSAAKEVIRIVYSRFDGTPVRTKPRDPISPKPPCERFAAALAFIDRLAVLCSLRFEKTILRAKLWGAVFRPCDTAKALLAVLAFVTALPRFLVLDEAWAANIGDLFTPMMVVNFSATTLANVGHLAFQTYNIWPGR
jgi:hypothetical protein